MERERDEPERQDEGAADEQGRRAGHPDAGYPDTANENGEHENVEHEEPGQGPEERTGLGTEAIPAKAEQHTTEHESGYGGKKDRARVSSDQRPGT
jgi:hypothetical protein